MRIVHRVLVQHMAFMGVKAPEVARALDLEQRAWNHGVVDDSALVHDDRAAMHTLPRYLRMVFTMWLRASYEWRAGDTQLVHDVMTLAGHVCAGRMTILELVASPILFPEVL